MLNEPRCLVSVLVYMAERQPGMPPLWPMTVVPQASSSTSMPALTVEPQCDRVQVENMPAMVRSVIVLVPKRAPCAVQQKISLISLAKAGFGSPVPTPVEMENSARRFRSGVE